MRSRGRGRGSRGRGRGRAAGTSRRGRGRGTKKKIIESDDEVEETQEIDESKLKDEKTNQDEDKPPKIDLEADISQLEAPTFTTINRGPPEPMVRLDWSHKVNLIGEKVLNPMIHCCDKCLKPILIYGRMIPCKHVFCLWCAKREGNQCPRCSDKVTRIEKAALGTVFMCTHAGSRYGNTGCRRTYLSQRDLQAHINHRHVSSATTSTTSTLHQSQQSNTSTHVTHSNQQSSTDYNAQATKNLEINNRLKTQTHQHSQTQQLSAHDPRQHQNLNTPHHQQSPVPQPPIHPQQSPVYHQRSNSVGNSSRPNISHYQTPGVQTTTNIIGSQSHMMPPVNNSSVNTNARSTNLITVPIQDNANLMPQQNLDNNSIHQTNPPVPIISNVQNYYPPNYAATTMAAATAVYSTTIQSIQVMSVSGGPPPSPMGAPLPPPTNQGISMQPTGPALSQMPPQTSPMPPSPMPLMNIAPPQGYYAQAPQNFMGSPYPPAQYTSTQQPPPPPNNPVSYPIPPQSNPQFPNSSVPPPPVSVPPPIPPPQHNYNFNNPPQQWNNNGQYYR